MHCHPHDLLTHVVWALCLQPKAKKSSQAKKGSKKDTTAAQNSIRTSSSKASSPSSRMKSRQSKSSGNSTTSSSSKTSISKPRALTGYQLFAKLNKQQLLESNSGSSSSSSSNGSSSGSSSGKHFLSLAANAWKLLNEEDKEQYKTMAKEHADTNQQQLAAANESEALSTVAPRALTKQVDKDGTQKRSYSTASSAKQGMPSSESKVTKSSSTIASGSKARASSRAASNSRNRQKALGVNEKPTAGTKRVLNAYQLFVQTNRQQLLQSNPGTVSKDVFGLAAKAWATLPDGDKEGYRQLAADTAAGRGDSSQGASQNSGTVADIGQVDTNGRHSSSNGSSGHEVLSSFSLSPPEVLVGQHQQR